MSRKKILRDIAASQVKPSSFLDYKPFFAALFSQAKEKLGKYTYHEYAEDMGFAATNIMHQFIRGHRKLTSKAAVQIVKLLDLRGTERRYFEAMVEYCNTNVPAKREELFQKMLLEKSQVLSSDQDKDWLDYLSEWYHPVVREIVGLQGFRADSQWISDQIQPRIRPEQARKSLELLERLGFIEATDDGNSYRQTEKSLSTGHAVRGIGFTRYHQKMIEMGKESLANAKGNKRDVSASTISVDEATFHKIKSMIHEFNAKVMTECGEAEHPDRVYQLNIQLFPFAEIKDQEDEA
ncbi:MAG: TIGR02147 family protein [Oligoflexus sp.]